MKRIRLVALLFLLPNLALAHAGQQGLILLLPTDMYIISGGLVVGLTILLAALMNHRQLHRMFAPHTITALPAPRTTFTSLLAMAVFFALIWLGLFGPHDPLANLMSLGVWTVIWIGLILICGVFGNLWTWINPWSGLFNLLAGPNPTPVLTLPARLGHYPAIATLMAFNGFAIANPAASDPQRLAILGCLYWMFTFVMMMLFGAKNWLYRGEFLTVFIHLIAKISPFKRDNSLKIGTPGWRIASCAPPSLSLALFALILLGTGTFDGLNETFFWLGQIGINPLDFPGRSAIVTQTVAGLIAVNICLCLIFYACVRVTAPAAHVSALFRRQALTILPIAFVYHFAHFLPSLLVDGQYTIQALSDPLKTGVDFFNLGPFYVTTGFFNTTATVKVIFLTQASAIVLGHMLAILLSHRVACDYFKTRRAVLVSQIPLSVFMIGYTILGLWLLATPKGA